MSLVRLLVRPQYTRMYAVGSSNAPVNLNTVGPYQVFDRHAKCIQKDRAARLTGGNRSRTVDYLRDEVAERMLERFLVRAYHFFESCIME